MTPPRTGPRVYVHIGVPKSGTTFVQATLGENRESLQARGVLVPGDRDSMFRAALDFRGNHKAWGRTGKEVEGAWAEVCRLARHHDGDTIISHELLAAASTRRIVAGFTLLKGLDVHVVVTARDPARQVTAEWQEGIKHGRTLTFEEFRAEVLDGAADTDHARRFRAAQDLAEVLRRWTAVVPAPKLHVVCCPVPATPPGVLWARFCEAVDLDPVAFPHAASDSRNASLGVDQIDLLRRVNVALDARLKQPEYGRVVKRYYAQTLLPLHRSARPTAPAEMYDDFTSRAKSWVREIEEAGYPVHGDLAELIPSAPEPSAADPGDVSAAQQVETAAGTTAGLLLEVARLQARVEELKTDRKSLEKRRHKLKKKLKAATSAASSH